MTLYPPPLPPPPPPPPRKALAFLALLGSLECLFLTLIKTFTSPATLSKICSTVSLGVPGGGCNEVLTGPYASVHGIPLTFPGFLAYAAVFLLSVLPLVPQYQARPLITEEQNRLLLLMSTTGLGFFSFLLMSLLAFVIRDYCPFCIASALISFSLALTAWFSSLGTNLTIKRRVAAGFSSVAVVCAFAFGIFINGENVLLDSAVASPNPSSVLIKSESEKKSREELEPPPVTNKSSKQAEKIGDQLTKLNSRMFGAYWCSHCFEQKQTLGKQAMAKIPYLECAKDGKDSEWRVCKDLKLPGYPCWEINGNIYPGEQSLDELQEIINIENGMEE
ncbi:hypothetical protein ScalyP_jg10906 [Parmales sp. scaly parma]|nr:hypothetical protein ScalyP_jg10906 [Parmales sp. scaly parma]